MTTKLAVALTILGLPWAAWPPARVAGQSPGSTSPIQVFEIQERFGVSHPDEIIDFDLAGKINPANSRMIGPDGKETLFQLLEGGKKVAVRTDLPAGMKKTWKLMEGRPSAETAEAVQVEERPNYFAITAGPSGVRVPKACDPSSAKPGAVPAPVQGIRLRDGAWAATGPNPIKLDGLFKKMQVRFVEKGPLKVVVEVSYDVDRLESTAIRGNLVAVDPAGGTIEVTPNNYLDRIHLPALLLRFVAGSGPGAATLPTPLTAGKTYYAKCVGPDSFQLAESREGPPIKLAAGLSGKPAVAVVIPGGRAVAKTTLTVEAGQPSILFEQESEVDASYALDFGGLKLDQGRYRGHHANSKEAGREKDGRTYRMWHERPGMDAFFDFPFDRDYPSGYVTNLRAEPMIRRVAIWDPWVYDGGWYWQAYDQRGGADKVFTLNLMAEGAVDTPAGKVTPTARMWGYERRFGDRHELASAGQVFALPAGVSRLAFTGQTWKAHGTKGIDFSVFVVADAEQQAQVGNWGHAWTTSPGAAQFREANGREFDERQHILRLRSPGGFRVFLVAYPKGRRPADIQVRREGRQVAVSAAGRTVRFSVDGKYEP